MRKTKWMAAVLSVCLILVMLPTVAFAEGHAKSTGNAEHDNPFGDIHEGDYYYDAVLWAVEQGITYTHVTGDMQKRASEIMGGFMESIMVR